MFPYQPDVEPSLSAPSMMAVGASSECTAILEHPISADLGLHIKRTEEHLASIIECFSATLAGRSEPPLPILSSRSTILAAPQNPDHLDLPSTQTYHTRTLKLANNLSITFSEDEVPDPPAVGFANNIPALDRMWDDTSSAWDGHSDLVIQGKPIALIYWPDVYKYWKGTQWQGTKGRFSEWKVRFCFFTQTKI